MFLTIIDEVQFGEVVQEPPRLKAKPRGFQKETRKNKSHSLLLLDMVTEKSSTPKSKTVMGSRKQGGLKRQREIEIERERAIQQYRQMKKARTKNSTLR